MNNRTEHLSERHRRLLKQGRWIEIGSFIYNSTEVVVSLIAGFLSGSSALISWGLDSTVEAASAGTMVWRLHGEEERIGRRRVLWRKKVAMSVIAAAFFIVVGFILYEATSKFISQEKPDFSALGIGILILSLLINPLLAWGKYRTGKQLQAESLVYDAIDTLVCQYQTIVVLIGLILTATLDWWWADPVAALAIVPYVAWEGVKVARGAWRVDPSSAEAEPRPRGRS